MKKEIRHPELAKRLQYACDKLGLLAEGEGRQRAIATGVGCTQEAARKWLKGYTRPSHRFVEKLATFLLVDVGYLEYGVEPPSIKKAKHAISLEDKLDGAFYMVYAAFRLRGIPIVVAPDDNAEDLTIFYRGKQHLITVALAEQTERDGSDYRVHTRRELEAGTHAIIVIPKSSFGQADLVPLSWNHMKVLGTAKGNYLEYTVTKKGRDYLIDDRKLDAKVVPDHLFV